MLFNSLEFVVFFPIVFAVYWLARQNGKLQNAILVVASGVLCMGGLEIYLLNWLYSHVDIYYRASIA